MQSQENDFPGLDVHKCYQIIEQLNSMQFGLNPTEIQKCKEFFWNVLQEEVQKINNGYKDRERLCAERFKMFDFETFMINRVIHSQTSINTMTISEPSLPFSFPFPPSTTNTIINTNSNSNSNSNANINTTAIITPTIINNNNSEEYRNSLQDNHISFEAEKAIGSELTRIKSESNNISLSNKMKNSDLENINYKIESMKEIIEVPIDFNKEPFVSLTPKQTFSSTITSAPATTATTPLNASFLMMNGASTNEEPLLYSYEEAQSEMMGLFQEALREVYPHFEIAQMSIDISHDITNPNKSGHCSRGTSGSSGGGSCDGNKFPSGHGSWSSKKKCNENLANYAKFYSFCELLRDVHLLRDFTIQTFNIVTLLVGEMKKIAYNSNSLQEVTEFEQKFRSLCDVELYKSKILAKLCTRTEVIATSLLCSQNACAPQQTAFVCFRCHQLDQDMYVLRCFHRFCGFCIGEMKEQNCMDCMTCGRHNALQGIVKDRPLRAFIATHFPVESARIVAMRRQSNSMNVDSIRPMPMTSQIPTYLIPTHHLDTNLHQPCSNYFGSGTTSQIARGTTDTITDIRSCTENATRSTAKSGPAGSKRAKTSCHQCKNNKDPNELLFCKNVKWGPGKKPGNYVLKHCRKKFCSQCMSKYIPFEQVEELFVRQQANETITDWKCPACADTCECAACWRRRNPDVNSNAPHSIVTQTQSSKKSDSSDAEKESTQ